MGENVEGEGGSRDLRVYPCGYLFRYKICDSCGFQNDLSARTCKNCKSPFVEVRDRLKKARLSKNAHVLVPDSVEMSEGFDKRGNSFLQVNYYDLDGQYLSEIHYLNNPTSLKKFDINFLRFHLKKPEILLKIKSVKQFLTLREYLRMPSFVIGRKRGFFWKITEKIFEEELYFRG